VATAAGGPCIAFVVTEALAAALRHGIVDRDLEPCNLFLLGGAADDVHVIDFASARPARSGSRSLA
jgi:hypothetical protein